MPDVLYFNGRWTTTDERVLGVEDRGFLFGDGIYEVFKFLGRRAILLADHWQRFCRNVDALELPNPWSEASFRATMGEILERSAADDGIVYIEVTRGEGARAHFWAEGMTPTVIAYPRKFVFPDEKKREMGMSVVTMEDIRWDRCDIKSVNLLANAMSKKKAQRAGAEEAILVKNGEVREGASANFFAVIGGRVITHPLDEHILPGTVRNRVITLALEERIRVDERPVKEPELLTLEEAFITSTTQGVMPISEIDGHLVGNGRCGEVTRALQRSFSRLEQESLG